MYIFYESCQLLEKEKNSVFEILAILNDLIGKLEKRAESNFMPFLVRLELQKLEEAGFEKECVEFTQNVQKCYNQAIDYIKKWTAPYNQFKEFSWIMLEEIPQWKDVDKTIEYLRKKNISIDESSAFDQFHILKEFVEKHSKQLLEKSSAEKWVMFFEDKQHKTCYSELLKICQFFFALGGQNANVERVFSMIETQWTKDRNRLEVSTINAIATVSYNYKNVSCLEFYKKIKDNSELLKKIAGSEKYENNKN